MLNNKWAPPQFRKQYFCLLKLFQRILVKKKLGIFWGVSEKAKKNQMWEDSCPNSPYNASPPHLPTNHLSCYAGGEQEGERREASPSCSTWPVTCYTACQIQVDLGHPSRGHVQEPTPVGSARPFSGSQYHSLQYPFGMPSGDRAWGCYFPVVQTDPSSQIRSRAGRGGLLLDVLAIGLWCPAGFSFVPQCCSPRDNWERLRGRWGLDVTNMQVTLSSTFPFREILGRLYSREVLNHCLGAMTK